MHNDSTAREGRFSFLFFSHIIQQRYHFGYLAENMFAQTVRCDDFIEIAFSSLTEQMFCGRMNNTKRCVRGRMYGTSVYVYRSQ
jgi:hypothetical protein